MKSKLTGVLAAVALALAVQVGDAKANVLTTFDVNVNYTYPTTGSFSGTMTVDVTAGQIVSADIVFPGFPQPLTYILNSVPVADWLVDIGGAADYNHNFVELEFTTTNPHSLIGFTGGTIFADGVAQTFNGSGCVAGCGSPGTFTGTISPAVPEPSTWAMMILGFAGIVLMTYRRKSKPALVAA